MSSVTSISRSLSVAAGLLAFALAGCETLGGAIWLPSTKTDAAVTVTVQDAADIKYYPSDEPLRLGAEHFNRGHYGLAERYFRDAVEKAPKDPAAWIGLAGSYDRIARFDLADRAYREAIKLQGETPQILNNLGYSYMLRGDLTLARVKFAQAFQLAPADPTIINNIKLLNASYRFIEHPPYLNGVAIP